MVNRVYRRLSLENIELNPLKNQASKRDEITGLESERLVGWQERPCTTSRWGVGWRTPFFMVVFYLLALLLAFLHLGLFLYLNHKPAVGKERAVPQSYVSTASNILSNTFGLCLKTSLAIASTQLLWYTLRQSPLRVSTIESLFQLRFNPFLMFDRLVIASGPILVLITITIWSIQIAASFPPGALTVATSNRTSINAMNIPTFNASFFGNGSGYDAQRYSFNGFTSSGHFETANTTLYPTSDESETLPQPYVQNSAIHTLVNGAPSNMPSPCGANCSFTLALDVPYLKCSSSTFNVSFEGNASLFDYPMFNATWSDYVFNVTTYYTFSATTEASDTSRWLALTQANNTICTPARANYTLDIMYENNVKTVSISNGLVTPLNISSPAPSNSSEEPPTTNAGPGIIFPGFMGETTNGTSFFGTEALDWTPPFVSWYRDLQLMALISGMAESLAGNVIFTHPGIGNLGTVAPNTPINTGNGIYVQDTPPSLNAPQPSFIRTYHYVVTPSLLNDFLLNITMSAITDFGWWSANSTPVTQWETITVFSFSKPMNLIIPYFFSLFLAIPILGIGFLALKSNGVAAIDGGFTQLVTTSTGSKTLEKVAAGGCLGGNENVPVGLKELKVRFGELVGDSNGGLVRRAGFGTENETRPLVKGALYGI
ncbi:hypothetical protein N431DRAFT_338567 [Stipitochalara longipes BDJ]|nr:hypothetical protein N431DRAFT_338567 [Stipitochalara longipes BDJ]